MTYANLVNEMTTITHKLASVRSHLTIKLYKLIYMGITVEAADFWACARKVYQHVDNTF